MLIERLAGEILHRLADAAADQIADGVADRIGAAGDRAGGFELAGQRRHHHQCVGPAGHGERPARNIEVEVGIGQKLRHRILRLAGQIARRLRVERVADRG